MIRLSRSFDPGLFWWGNARMNTHEQSLVGVFTPVYNREEFFDGVHRKYLGTNVL